MLKKIISSGQTEAELAALDAAIKLEVPHGGWIPKRKLPETGTLPAKYRLQEMPTHTYSECIEQNVIDSKGTLILSCGKPTGNLDFARKMTLKHRHQLLGIDLDLTNFIEAASLVHDWIQLRRIDALYVTGSGAAANPDVGNHTTFIVESAIARNESRGAHFREDFDTRDDENFLKHTMAYMDENGDISLDYMDVVLGKHELKARTY